MFAVKAVEVPGMKLVALTVTFKPSLGVTYQNIAKVRHALFEFLRRRLTTQPLEYVCVVERHQSGKPHLHIIIWYWSVRALQRDARTAVKGSFVSAKLVKDDRQLSYLSKYAGKQAGAKLTSSRNVARLAEPRGEKWQLISIKPDGLTFDEWRAKVERSLDE